MERTVHGCGENAEDVIKKFLLILFVIVVFGLTYLWWDKNESSYGPHPEVNDIIEELEKVNPYYVIAYPEDYEELSKKEYDENINFPIKKAHTATLHSSRFFSVPYDLTDKEMTQLLEILNDSASYKWGESGTPEVHYYFTFHDADDNVIGLTTIDVIGMAYSRPHLARMKWCDLKRMDEVLELIEEIKE